MCYSAQVWADYDAYVRAYGADIDIRTFVELYVEKREGAKLKTPRAMDRSFHGNAGPEFAKIEGLVEAIHAQDIAQMEQELFKQTKRLADAQRKLATKPTKAAEKDAEIAPRKIEQLKGRLTNLKRKEDRPSDHRIFPGMYAPVMVWDDGRRVVKPMRYQCRPAGKTASYDRRYPGTYNARRDNLEGFWRGQFGATHAVMVADRFYENVATDEGNQVLEFVPRTHEPMLIACLWSEWHDPKGEEPSLLSFAAITDEPEPEVAEAGHDRTVINLKEEHLDAWLNPAGDLEALYRLLDDKQHPYYEHRKAA